MVNLDVAETEGLRGGGFVLVHPGVLGNVNLASACPELGKTRINLTTSVLTVILYFRTFNQLLTYFLLNRSI